MSRDFSPKKKKTQEPDMAVPVNAGEVNVKKTFLLRLVPLILFFVYAFLAIFISSGIATMWSILAAVAFQIFLLIRKTPFGTLKTHCCLPVLGLALMALLQGIAAIRTPFEEEGISVFYIFLAAYSLIVTVLTAFEQKDTRALLYGFMGVNTIVAWLGTDWASAKLTYEAICKLGATLNTIYSNFEAGSVHSRVQGIFADANVTASMFALAVILGLYMMRTETSRLRRLIAAVMLGVNAVGFLVSMSRGAMLCFALALVAYLAFERKGSRLRLFILMCISAIVTVGCTAVIWLTPEETITADLISFLCGPIIFVLDGLVSAPLTNFLAKRQKLMVISAGTLATACVVFVIAAVQVTGPYTLNSSSVYRAVDLKPGSYTVSGDWDGELQLKVICEDKEGLLVDRSTTPYDGDLKGASFVIPEDTGKTTVEISAEGGPYEVRDVVFSDGTRLKLNYKFLPKSIADRLQDSLLTSASFLLRLQYFKDAFKIFLMSPVIGVGLGSTEGFNTAVQPIFYMSKYCHNHVLQYMSDTGILGLLAFLLFMGGTAWVLLKQRKKDGSPLAAAFLACLVMMNVHSLMEINFSVRGYFCTVMVLLGMMIVTCGESDLVTANEKTKKRVAMAVGAALTALLVLWGGVMEAYRQVQFDSVEFETTDYDEFMDRLDLYIHADLLDNSYHKILYVENGLQDSKYYGKVLQYVDDLVDSGTYTNCQSMALKYFLPTGRMEEAFEVSRKAIAQKASDKDSWNFVFDSYWENYLSFCDETNMDVFLEGVLGTRDYLLSYSLDRLEEIELTEENKAFIDEVDQVYRSSMSGQEAYDYLADLYLPE